MCEQKLEEALFVYTLKREILKIFIFLKIQRYGSALLCYAVIISVQKLTRVTKSNTEGFLRIQRQKNTKGNTKKTAEINLDKGRICSKHWSKRIPD